MSLLQQYGWNTYFDQQFSSFKSQGLSAGRVIAIHGQHIELVSEQGLMSAEISGSLQNSKDFWDLPKVGDWVVFTAYDTLGYIIDVLPRQTELARKLPGKSIEKQVMATNIDVAFILQGLDHDFNLMRLQRYLLQIMKSNIQPIVILNKADLVENPETYQQEVQSLGYQIPVLLVSALREQSLEALKSQYLLPKKTYALLGSSGVGKSTLMNALLGVEFNKTSAISNFNQKGKHTTTSRNLVMLPNGSMLIDAPGMREFGLTAEAGEPLSAHHPQIEELSAACKFQDCLHQHEPGCAVIAALEDGTLPELVYKSYLKLLREQNRFSISLEEKRRNERQFGKLTREANQFRKKNKN